MQLPPELRDSIEREASAFPRSALAAAAGRLSAAYRAAEDLQPHGFTDIGAAAYSLVRFPATYAAVVAALSASAADAEVRSLLDLGAGSGAAAWAAHSCYGSIEEITLIERDSTLISLGRKLSLPNARWREADLNIPISLPEHDLVILSYSLGELAADRRLPLVESAWQAARRLFVIVEPGSPRGFAVVRAARGHLLQLGGHLAAPCPHEQPCPMPPDDWCHFAARIERTALHRRLKSADLGYEDEKFSYVAVSREPSGLAPARIIRRPLVEAGLIQLSLCTPSGLEHRKITRRDREAWRHARKSRWGDAWPETRS